MTNLESLRSLQRRIREAQGADRELDDEIFAALFPEKSCRLVGMHEGYPDIRMFEFSHATGTSLRVTGSLDACVALMREVLPGCEWSRSYFRRFAIWKVNKRRTVGSVLADTDPLANDCLTFLDAIFSAAIAKEEAKEKADV